MGKQEGPKREKMEVRFKDELNLIIRREISNPHLQFVSITKVELSPDFSWARAYWDTFDLKKRGDIKKALKGSSGKFRSCLAKAFPIRFIPEIQFEYDSQFEDERKIENLMKNGDDSDSSDS